MTDKALMMGFYGDDFTGSTDAMEALTREGVRTVLFLHPPTSDTLARFADIQAVGVAGISRSLPVEQMEQELRPTLSWMHTLNLPLVHYKICSTFDSSPTIGSIGRAIEVGQSIYRSLFVPLVVGAPRLGRYCVFGNLFARSGPESEPTRLDRHPTMRRHPITPMDESDLRIHLGRQTDRSIALFDIRQIALPYEKAVDSFDKLLKTHPDIVLFDVLYDSQLANIGKLIWSHAGLDAPLFTAGSSGVEYALTAHWRNAGLIGDAIAFRDPGSVHQMVVVSGSCSPVSDRQIAWALDNGFDEVPLQTDLLGDPASAEGEETRAIRQALDALSAGHSVIVHTSRGPSDPRISLSRSHQSSAKVLGGSLGRILRELVTQTGLRRAAVAGGDTCGYVARTLGITALEILAPMAPGAPLCKVYAEDKHLDGCEILFKGGQVGRMELYGDVLRGRTL